MRSLGTLPAVITAALSLLHTTAKWWALRQALWYSRLSLDGQRCMRDLNQLISPASVGWCCQKQPYQRAWTDRALSGVANHAHTDGKRESTFTIPFSNTNQ